MKLQSVSYVNCSMKKQNSEHLESVTFCLKYKLYISHIGVSEWIDLKFPSFAR